MFFKTYLIDTNTNVNCVHDIFVNVHKHYNISLRQSINNEVLYGCLPRIGNPLHYNYIILDGTKLNKILDNYNQSDLMPVSINNNDFLGFRALCDYVGKGTNDRKLQHLILGKQILMKQMVLEKISAKFSKITQIWEKGHGIVILHLFSETNHYEAMSREYSMIKSLGLNNITNNINGSAFGVMKSKWNIFEVMNYGNMLLYNSFKMTIQENPPLIFPENILRNPRSTSRKCTLEDYELEGILNCFLEL